MWIVRLALRRPYTIAVSCILIFIIGILSLRTMLVDIFPVIDIPVVAVVWAYPGLSAEDMERRVVLITERAMSTSVNGIARIESQSIPGIGLLRVYFQDGTDIGAAIAQISAMTGTILRILPPGMTPPVIVQFNASNLPVAQMTITSDSLPEQKLFDYGLNFIRVKLFTIPGLATPAPYGGKQRQINIDVNPNALTARGLSPADILSALQASNIILPAGTARIGKFEYNVALNSSPSAVEQFGQIPIKVVNGTPILLGDVARVSDSFADQANVVRINGRRATYLNILRKANASTLAVVEAAKEAIPEIKATAPQGMELKIDFDQSTFVRAAIKNVVHEGVIAAILVSLMILVFLGSWRSVLVVCTSIPLAIMVSIIGLKFTGNSINIMTLGGLSLAIGMLVDDATVEVENIHRNRSLGFPLTVAVLRGASQIALPAIMATLAICIVFFPVVLLTGPARFLFTPMALSVVFAMLASYVLSRTLVPTLSRMLMEHEHHEGSAEAEQTRHRTKGRIALFLERFNERREVIFGRVTERYTALLGTLLGMRRFALGAFFTLLAATMVLPFVVGTDFFPATDTGIMKLHVRAPSGTRVEETEKLIERVEARIREIVPAEELSTINATLGVPTSYNLAFTPSDNTSAMDADVLVALKADHHPTVRYVQQIRKALVEELPGSKIYFQPADIVSQVLNFGLSAPIDVQIEFPDVVKSYEYAKTLRAKLMGIPGLTDVNIKQVFDYPQLRMNVDRIRAAQVGVSQRDIANSMLIALSSSLMVGPSYFLNPQNNVNYSVAVKVPLPRMQTVDDLANMPVTPSQVASAGAQAGLATIPGAPAQRLGNISQMVTESTLSQINHSNVQRVVNVTANVEGRDLGTVTRRIDKAIASLGKLPPGMRITQRGQGQVMRQAFGQLGLGLILAIALVYLLMVVLFQSWMDPFIVLIAVPGALIGILWMMLVTGTTINVVSFLGSIMAVGIASSNSILLVSFANDVRTSKGLSAVDAALEAGKTRLRPVLMTALAMILGMLPTAMAFGEGGEQNAPLGKSVIGGLLVATVVTLFIVPIVYSLLRTKLPTLHLLDERFNAEAEGHSGDEAEKLAVERTREAAQREESETPHDGHGRGNGHGPDGSGVRTPAGHSSN